MDDYRNERNNRSDNSQWDRWNSNASNSSYYNQPVHRPYGMGFSYASFILGVFSVTTGCFGIGLPIGALGIFFAMLVYRKGRKMNSVAKSGLVLSSIGALLGLILIIYIQYVMMDFQQWRQNRESQAQTESTNGSDQESDEDLMELYYYYLMDYYGISPEP